MRAESPDDITNLIAKPKEEYPAEERYVSKYREKIVKASKRGKSAHKTLGVPSVSLNAPTDFLRKRSQSASGAKKISVSKHEHYRRPDYQRKLPEWQPVKASEREEASENRIDFAKRNVEEVKNSQPKKPRRYFVDDRHGNSQSLRLSGLYPLYRSRKSFGQVPGNTGAAQKAGRKEEKSLKGRGATSPRGREEKSGKKSGRSKDAKSKRPQSPRGREEKSGKTSPRSSDPKGKRSQSPRVGKSTDKKVPESTGKNGKEEKSRIADDLPEEVDGKSSKSGSGSVDSSRASTTLSSTPRAGYQQPRCRYVTEDERAHLLLGMKKKWDEMMHKFQCLPFLTDTAPKAKRKSKMEKDLLQLEKDIETIERHPYIYVYSDPED